MSPFLRGHFRRLSFYQFFVRAFVDIFVHLSMNKDNVVTFESFKAMNVGVVFECLVFEISWEHGRRMRSLENVLEFTRRAKLRS